jgi:hypothetical protein
MIAADVATRIRRQVADQISIEYVESDRLEVSTPFMFSDGDHYGCAVLRNGATGRWKISDEGEVVSKARSQGVDLLGKGRADRLRRTIEFYGLQEHDGELSIEVDDGEFGKAFFLFSQACLDVNRLAKLKADRPARTAKQPSERNARNELVSLVERAISCVNYEPEWHHPQLDPHRIYTVDFYIPVMQRVVLLFVASDDRECLDSTIACQHYRQNRLPFNSVAISDDSLGIAGRNLITLRDAMDAHFSPDQEEELVRFVRTSFA